MARGTEQQCIDYCSKEDTHCKMLQDSYELVGIEGSYGPFYRGSKSEQRQRTNLTEIVQHLKSGGSLDGIDPVAILKYPKGITMLQSLVSAPKRKPLDIYYCSGTTGISKSFLVRTYFERLGKSVFTLEVGNCGTWCDGYNKEEVLILDEFSGAGMPLTKLNRFLDHYKFAAEVKGGTVQACWTTVIVVANEHIDELYGGVAKVKRDTVMRRLGLGTPRCFWGTTMPEFA